jgi:hypothetical protein
LRSTPITLLILSAAFSASTVRAQQVDAYLGAGTARASSNGQNIDTFGDGALHPTAAIDGVFTDFSVSVFFKQQMGVSWTVSWRPAHDYAGLEYRLSFNTFDAISAQHPTLVMGRTPGSKLQSAAQSCLGINGRS